MQARFLVAGCLCLGLVGLWLGVVLAYGTILEVGVQPDEQLAMVGTLPAFTMPPPFKPPKTGEEWKDDDSQLAETVFPAVLEAEGIDEKSKILGEGIYNHFASKYGLLDKRRYTSQPRPHNHNRP